MSRVVEVCDKCRGSGLEPCAENLNIKARNHHKYIKCKKCKGEGVPEAV